MKPARRSTCPAPRAQRGVVLIIAMALLLMLTLLSVGMFRGLGLEERITGNTREKQRAFYFAQSTLQYAENWLTQSGNATFGTACSTTAQSATPVVCNQASALSETALATTEWNGSFGTPYTPPTALSALTTYSAPTSNPQFAIVYLGNDPNTSGNYLYQVTALAYGASSNSVAVVQSVYSVGGGGSCVSCSH